MTFLYGCKVVLSQPGEFISLSSHGLFSSFELHEPSKEKKRLILFAGVLQLLEYGSVNHCTGLLLPVFEIMG